MKRTCLERSKLLAPIQYGFVLCQEPKRPHLFPPPQDAGEEQGRGLNDLNDSNVWNQSREDIDRGGIHNFC
jgi:hypothetical protein